MSTAPDLLQLNPFHRLNQLLAGLTPGASPLPDGQPINLSVGDPRTTMPAFAAEAMRAAEAGWSRYAPARGHPGYLVRQDPPAAFQSLRRCAEGRRQGRLPSKASLTNRR